MTEENKNLEYENPEDYIYVSKRHYRRKLRVKDDKLGSIVGRPGPIAGLVFYILDTIVVFCVKILFVFIKIAKYAFNLVERAAFANFTGFFPKGDKNSMVFTSRFGRYLLTLLIPPAGILMGKGVYGWFSVIICMLLTYINYLAGIIFAFVITSRNRYADQYEKWEINDMRARTEQNLQEIEDDSAFFAIIGFFIIMIIFLVTIFLST